RATRERRPPARGAWQVVNYHTRVIVEDKPTDVGWGVAIEENCLQAGAVIERLAPDTCDAAQDRDAGQIGAASKRPIRDARNAGGNRKACQADAASERGVPNVGDAIWDRDTRQVAAACESRLSDTGHGLRD